MTNNKFSKQAAIIITILVFFTLSFAVNAVCNIHKNRYMMSCPDDGKILVQITCCIYHIGGRGSVGNEWSYEHFLNNQRFKDGEILIINAKESFFIRSKFIEHDSISDIGETTSKNYIYDNYTNPLTISQKVHVVEQGGRSNAGSTEDFNVVYTLKRVIPSSMSFWDLFLYTSNALEYLLCVLLIASLPICVMVGICIIVNNKREKDIQREG